MFIFAEAKVNWPWDDECNISAGAPRGCLLEVCVREFSLIHYRNSKVFLYRQSFYKSRRLNIIVKWGYTDRMQCETQNINIYTIVIIGAEMCELYNCLVWSMRTVADRYKNQHTFLARTKNFQFKLRHFLYLLFYFVTKIILFFYYAILPSIQTAS